MLEFLSNLTILPKWRSDIKNIIRSSDRAVEIIEEHFKKKTRDQPLYVALGEEHTKAGHLVAEMRIIKILKERGFRVAFGNEIAHDYLDKFMGTKAQGFLKGDEIQLQVLSATQQRSPAPLTFKTQSAFLLRHGISASFNDASRDYGDVKVALDQLDPLTRQSIIDVGYGCFLKSSFAVNSMSGPGMHIRNHFMVREAIRHAELARPEIYIQRIGSAHIFGRPGQYPAEESWLAMAKKAGIPALGIPFMKARYARSNVPDNLITDQCAFLSSSFTADGQPAHEHEWLRTVMKKVMPDCSDHLDIQGFVDLCRLKARDVKCSSLTPA